MTKLTLMKTTSYAVMHFTIAVIVAYALTRSWELALAIGILEPMAQTVAFFFHESAWHKYTTQQDKKDHHDSVTDSVSPLTRWIEKYLRRHKG